MDKTLLLTGFEPFGGETLNPSGLVVARIPECIGGIKIIKKILPVHFNRARNEIEESIRLYQLDAIISLGQAGGRKTLSVEKTAQNIAKGNTCEGDSREGSPIIAGAPAAYFSTLPVDAIVKKVNEAGIPCEASYFAGTYICNCVLFTALCMTRDSGTKCGFIHLPFSLEQGVFKSVPTMAVRDMVTGVEAAIAAVFE